MRVIVSEGFASGLAFGIVAFALPLYARQLGLELPQIGALMSLYLGVATILKPLIARVGDRLGYLRSVTLSLGIQSLLYLLLPFAASPWFLYALEAARGGAKAVEEPAMNALITDQSSSRKLASVFAQYHTAKNVAGPAGGALAGVLLAATSSDFTWVFGVAAVLSTLPCVFLSLLWSRFPIACSHSLPERPMLVSQSRLSQPGYRHGHNLIPYMGFGFLTAGTACMIQGIDPLLLVEYVGLNEAQAGLLYLVSVITAPVSTLAFGWLYDHVNREAVLMTRSLANVTSSAFYLLWPTFFGCALARVLDQAGSAAFRPAWASLMAEVCSKRRATRAGRIGLLDAGKSAGAFIAPMLGGLLWSVGGVAALMGTRIALALVTELYAFLLLHPAAERAQEHVKPKST